MLGGSGPRLSRIKIFVFYLLEVDTCNICMGERVKIARFSENVWVEGSGGVSPSLVE